jgi:hypothetical protein
MMRAALAALALTVAAPALAQAVDPGAMASAERLMEAMDVKGQFELMFQVSAPMMAKSAVAQLEVSPTTRPMMEALSGGDYARKQRMEAILAEEYLAAFRVQMPRLIREMAREYAAAMTGAELDALTAFFRSGAGAKYVKLQPDLQRKLTQVNQQIGMEVGMVATPKALERAKTEFEAETKK